jgi:hypothetical protein
MTFLTAKLRLISVLILLMKFVKVKRMFINVVFVGLPSIKLFPAKYVMYYSSLSIILEYLPLISMHNSKTLFHFNTELLERQTYRAI